jgi:hypothetical protein
MGGGTWSATAYASTTGANIRSGNTFGYTTSTGRKSRDQWTAHEDLDPLKVCGPTSPFAGRNIRESRDSAEHPNSTPIAIYFDVTGSMGYVPRELQKNLATLFSLLVDKGLAPDPQILIGAYGDAEWDVVPLQASQFESDNRVDDALDKIFLEGGGAGNGHEHSALAWYYTAMHTDTDNFNKRGKRGYLFTIGDEITGDIPAAAIRKYTGDGAETNVTPKQALAMASEKWHVFHIVIKNWTAETQGSVAFYSNLLKSNCVVIEDVSSVAEMIAAIVGFVEGTFDPTVTGTVEVIREVKALASKPPLQITSV